MKRCLQTWLLLTGLFFTETLSAQLIAPFTESFDNTATPTGWTQTAAFGGPWAFGAPGITWNTSACVDVPADHTGNGGNYAAVDMSSDDAAVTLTTPVIDVSALTNPVLYFQHFMCTEVYSPANILVVEAFDGTAFNEVATINTGVAAWTEQSFNLASFVYGTDLVQLQFRAESGGAGDDWRGDIAIDDVQVVEAPAVPDCPTLTGPVDGATDQYRNLRLTWNPAVTGEAPTGYRLLFGTDPLALNDLGVLGGTSTGITNMVFGATYYWSIVPVNAGGENTSCNATVFSYTLIDAPTAPTGVTCSANGNVSTVVATQEIDTNTGWTGVDGGAGNWAISTAGTPSPNTGPEAPYSGGGYMHFEASGAGTTTGTAISPAIDLTAVTDDAELSFWMHAFGFGIGDFVVGAGISQTGPFTDVFTWEGSLENSNAAAWRNIGADLSAFVGQTIYLSFQHTATDDFRGDVSIDLIEVTGCAPPPTCISPASLTIGTTTATSVELDWTAATGVVDGYDYLVQLASAALPDENTPRTGNVGGATTTAMTGVMAATAYNAYVRSTCPGGETGSWTGPVPFVTPPANDACADAIALNDANGMPSAASGTTYNSEGADPVMSSPAVTCNEFDGDADDDTWFSITVPTNSSVTITVVGGANFDAVIQAYSGSCTGLVAEDCADNSPSSGGTEILTLTDNSGGNGLLATTFLLQVFDFNAGGGEFTISVAAAVLPAELTKFTGQAEALANRLDWTTETEVNVDFFAVERSANGSDWTEIGSVQAAGNSTETVDYQYLDRQPLTIAYYRLRTVDFDGYTEYSDVVQVTRPRGTGNVAIAPNPTKGEAVMTLDLTTGDDVVITVTDIAGRVVSRTDYTLAEGLHTLDIDLSAQAAGVYFVQLQGRTLQLTERLLKD